MAMKENDGELSSEYNDLLMGDDLKKLADIHFKNEETTYSEIQSYIFAEAMLRLKKRKKWKEIM